MIYNLQALRGFAALLVVVTHVGDVFRVKGLGFGATGVDVFFVVSGFIMAHTAGTKTIGAGAFMARRIARIVPLYWLLTLALFVAVLVVPGIAKGTEASSLDLLRSLFFIPFVKPSGAMQPILFVGWTLNYEMAFYALFAIAIAVSPRGKGAIVCGATIVLVVLLGRVADPHWRVAGFYTDPVVVEFAIGIALAHVFRRGHAPRPSIAMAVLIAAVGALLVAPALFPSTERLVSGGLPAAAIVGAALSLEAKGWILNNGAVRAMGNASYSLYLSHPFTLACIALIASKTAVPTLVAAPASVLTAIVASLALYGWVEQPIGRLAKHGLLRRRRHIDHAAIVGAAAYVTISTSPGAR